MGLENTFNKVEKLPEEKKLEVITSKENILKDLEDYFEQNKFEDYIFAGEYLRKYFVSCMDFFKSFELNPEIIAEFNKKVGGVEEKEAFGLYLSALMQTSYNNRGFNNFIFNDINAHNFGIFLKGQPKYPIKITIQKELKGNWNLAWAKDCSLTAQTVKGDYSLVYAKNCSLTTEELVGDNSLGNCENYSLTTKVIKGYGSLSLGSAKDCMLKAESIKGDYHLRHAEGCLAEIQDYKGTYFGWRMTNCTIKSENKETIKTIKKQRWGGVNNRFELKK